MNSEGNVDVHQDPSVRESQLILKFLSPWSVKTNQEINANLLVRIAFGVKGFKNFSLLLEFFV